MVNGYYTLSGLSDDLLPFVLLSWQIIVDVELSFTMGTS